MSKIYNWEIKEQTVNEETEEEVEVTHAVTLRASLLWGKAVITIDGTEFDISTKPLRLRGTQQVFRLGDTAAILDFPKKRDPDIVIDGVCVRSGKPYGA